MEDTSGFYKLYGDELVFAPNAVYNKDFTLLREEKNTYTYPIDGWEWFDSKENAETKLK